MKVLDLPQSFAISSTKFRERSGRNCERSGRGGRNMKSQATKQRIQETIDILNYTFKQKTKGAGIFPDKKFLVKLRMSLIGKDTAFLSTDCMKVFYELYGKKPSLSKIYDLRFPMTFFFLRQFVTTVLCDIIIEYMGPDEDTCHICQCGIINKNEKHYMTKRHQANLQKIDLIPDILAKAYKNTIIDCNFFRNVSQCFAEGAEGAEEITIHRNKKKKNS